MALVAADIDIERSCPVRSRRDPDGRGIVLAESDERRPESEFWSTRVEEVGDMLIADVRVDRPRAEVST